MKASVLILAAILLAPAGFAQEAPTAAPPAQNDKILVTGEMREEAFKAQMEAERAAGEARREWQGLRDGHGNKDAGCRSAQDADLQYGQAIAEARALLKDAQSQPQLKATLDQRVDGMTERRRNLKEAYERICRGNGPGMGMGKAVGGGAKGRPLRPRP